MENLSPEPSKHADEKKLGIEAHFEPLTGRMLSEALEILASIIAECLSQEQDDS